MGKIDLVLSIVGFVCLLSRLNACVLITGNIHVMAFNVM
jgi:hypothetical protein